MTRTTNISFHKLKIDLEKSHGSYLYDSNSQSEFLDFFGMYSALTFGYNHEMTKDESYQKDILRASTVKVTNCEMLTEEYEDFVREFSNFAVPDNFSSLHLACTGGLAVEGGIKAALYHSSKKRGIPRDSCVVSFCGGFHGITSYGNFTTDRFGPAERRLSGFPDLGWPKIQNLSELQDLIDSGKNIGGVIIEPIQCTVGDNCFSDEFLTELRKITQDNDIPLIFDEVQTGFCSSGSVWYFQRLDWTPDIIIFGKKSQVSGFFVKKEFDSIFDSTQAGRLCITFDGDLVDLVRCTHVIKYIQQHSILDNINARAVQFREGLSAFPIKNIRNAGLLFCWDFNSADERDKFVSKLRANRMLCNPTGEKSIRMRPCLTVTAEEITIGIDLIKKTLLELRE